MRAYKRMTKFSILIAIISLLIAILLNFCLVVDKTGFWVNVCLGLFGSAALTILTSIVSYFHERRQTLESFVYHTRQILSYLNKYQESMPLEQKLKFYLDYHDLDKSAWDMDVGNMDFFFESKTHDFQYIYTTIYKPILDFNRAVENHVWHFRWYFDGTGKNDTVMEKFLLELQEYLLEKNEQDIPTEYDENGNIVSICHYSTVKPKLVLNIRKELNGRYYEIMYGKKIAKREMNSQEAQNNG